MLLSTGDLQVGTGSSVEADGSSDDKTLEELSKTRPTRQILKRHGVPETTMNEHTSEA
jgi:hypothetical protein